jgi:hypothetical protein
MKRIKVYVSGPITGISDYRYRFYQAAKYLYEHGYAPILPLQREVKGKQWRDYMKVAILRMLKCNAYYQLEGWHKSLGCNVENFIARCLGYKLI